MLCTLADWTAVEYKNIVSGQLACILITSKIGVNIFSYFNFSICSPVGDVVVNC